MSETLPVSFQYPVIVVEWTVLPFSISHWIASVISSSPRQDGLQVGDRLVDRRGEHVDADQGQVALRLAAASPPGPTTCPASFELGDAERRAGPITRVSMICASGCVARNSSTAR